MLYYVVSSGNKGFPKGKDKRKAKEMYSQRLSKEDAAALLYEKGIAVIKEDEKIFECTIDEHSQTMILKVGKNRKNSRSLVVAVEIFRIYYNNWTPHFEGNEMVVGFED